jgi:hypothetical protein
MLPLGVLLALKLSPAASEMLTLYFEVQTQA